MLEFFCGLSLTILCLYVLVDKLHKSDKDLHINKEGLEVCSAKQDSKSKWLSQGFVPCFFLFIFHFYSLYNKNYIFSICFKKI